MRPARPTFAAISLVMMALLACVSTPALAQQRKSILVHFVGKEPTNLSSRPMDDLRSIMDRQSAKVGTSIWTSRRTGQLLSMANDDNEFFSRTRPSNPAKPNDRAVILQLQANENNAGWREFTVFSPLKREREFTTNITIISSSEIEWLAPRFSWLMMLRYFAITKDHDQATRCKFLDLLMADIDFFLEKTQPRSRSYELLSALKKRPIPLDANEKCVS